MTDQWRARGIRRRFGLESRNAERADRDIDEQVQFHIAERVDQLMALGWTGEDAHREALRRFGSLNELLPSLHRAARAREETLHMRDLIHDAWLDVRLSLRTLRRHPAFAAITVLTLALGVGSASSMFAVVKHAVLDPLPFTAPDRLLFIGEQFSSGRDSAGRSGGEPMLASYPNFVDWRDRARSFDGLEAIGYSNASPVLGASEPLIGYVQNVSRGFFQLLGVRPIVGRLIPSDENKLGGTASSVMVSETFWREKLGAPNDLTSLKLTVFGAPRAVAGVIPHTFRLFGAADIWFPLETSPVRLRGAGNYWVIGRMRSGVALDAARAELNGIAHDLKATYGDASVSSAVYAAPLADEIIDSARKPLLTLLGAALFVLLATCVNVAMMMLARGSARTQETALRIALGSGWGRLVRAAAVETALLVAAGSAGGIALAGGVIAFVRMYGAGQVPRLNEVAFDGGVTLFAIAIAAVAALGFSTIPALAARRATRTPGTAPGGRVSRPSRAWSTLVAAQAAVAVMLALGAMLIGRTISNILHSNSGYDPHSVAVGLVPLTSQRYANDMVREQAGAQLLRVIANKLPGTIVGLASALPTDHGSGNGPLLLPPVINPNSQKEWAAIASTRFVTPGYFRALKIPLLRGRMFAADDRDGMPDVALVNEALAAKLWPGQNPIGKQVRALVDPRGALFTVVGVVGGAHDWRLATKSQIEMYVPFAQRPAQYVDLVVRSADPTALINEAMRAAVHDVDVTLPFRFRTLESGINETMADRRFIGGLLIGFAVVVVVLTTIGVFGAVSYAVSVLTREIGIRLAIGATRSHVWLAMQAAMFRTICIGTIIGGVAGWYGSRTLASLLYGTTAHDTTSFATAIGVVWAAAMAATAIPAWRAARIDPAIALRAE
jgi:putative ABC transport system permease protein